MGNFWLKLKVWTKTTLFSMLVIYGLLFIYNNSGQEVSFWWWIGHTRDHVDKLAFGAAAFLGGVILTILLRTTFTTMRQIRDLQDRSRTQRIERDVQGMKEKAARLQTRPSTATAIPSGAFEAPDPPTSTGERAQ